MAFNETITALGGNATFLGGSAILARDFAVAVKPLFLFTIAIVIYSMFIFKFYGYLAKRDVLDIEEENADAAIYSLFGKIGEITSHTFQKLVLIPIMVCFWFVVLAALLLLLSRGHTPQTLMLTALAVVASTRITSYYNEDLSRDLAKLIPFTLLAIFLFDLNYFSVDSSIALARQVPDYYVQFLHYLVFVVLLEFALRIFEFFVKKHRQFQDRRKKNLEAGLK